MSEHRVDLSIGIEFNRGWLLQFYRGRLLQFYRMKKERPADPAYWDMWEEQALREAIASAEAQVGAEDQREQYEQHIRSTVDPKIAEHALRKTATGEFESDAVRQDFSGWRDGYNCGVAAARFERIRALCSELQKANRGYTCPHNPPCRSGVS